MSEITLDKVPPLSSVSMKVMQFDPGHPDSDIQGLERIIMPDKGISAELLKIANSSLYGRSGRIKTLRDSITLLGLKTAKNLVVMLSTRNMNSLIKKQIFKRYILEYPVLSALISADLCGMIDKKAIRDEVFLAALLHKIGMTVIAINRPDEYNELLTNAQKSGQNILKTETTQFQTNHVKLGVELFKKWKMPDSLQEVVIKHHINGSNLNDLSDIVKITALSGLITSGLIQVPLSVSDKENLQNLTEHYKLPQEKIDSFNLNWYGLIKEHPFYQQGVNAG